MSLSTGLVNADSSTIDSILTAAEACFGATGYVATSMREIAQRARVSKGLLHYHFRSKEHLFLEMLVRLYNRLAAQITAAAARGATPVERALWAMDTLFAVLKANPDFQVQARVWAASLSNQRLRVHARRLREHLRHEIVRAIEQILGPATTSLPMRIEVAADIFWAMVSGVGLIAAADADPERATAAFDGLKRMVALALGGEPAT